MERKEEILILIKDLNSRINSTANQLSCYGEIDNISDENTKLLALSKQLADYIYEYKNIK